MSCPRGLLLLSALFLSTPDARAADVTADQIQSSFAKTWTKAQYIQATKDYYAAKHPDWNAYVASLSAGGNRFVLGELKCCAALYRETGDTKYSDAVCALLVGTINNNTMEYVAEMDFNYCYFQIRNSTSVSAADRTLIQNFISQRMDWLMTKDDDTTFVRGMINCAALAYAERLILPADPRAATWRAWHQAKWNLGMARIGDSTEDASNYSPMWFAGLYEYLRVTGADVAACFNQPSVRNFCERNLQAAACTGFVPSYGRGGTYSKQGQMPGLFETLATIYQDGRYKAVAQRQFNYMRTVVDPNWVFTDDICITPVFENANDTLTPIILTRPAVAEYDRWFIDRYFPDKLVMESGNHAGASSVLMNFSQGQNHGHAGGSALVSFIDKGSPLLINRDGDDDRVYHNLMLVRSTSEAFPFVPASAGEFGQQYLLDNVRRRFVLNIKGPQATNGGVPDPATLSKLTIYLGGATTSGGSPTFCLQIDDVKAVGPSGTLALSSGGSFLNPGNWTDVSFGSPRNLSAYDTVEFGMRIEVLVPGAITDVITLLQTATSGGYHFKPVLDTCSLGKTTEAQAFAKMQFASTEMQVKDTMGGNNLQRRDLMLAPGGILLVRDRVTFPAAQSNVQMGPVWNAAQVLSSGSNWYDLRQAKAYSLPQRQLLTLFPPRTDSGISFTTGTAKDPKSAAMIAYQKWTGNVTANNTRTFNSLLMGHDAGTSPDDLAATVQTLQCDETATVLKIGNNFHILNPGGTALDVGGIQTNAQSLYLEPNGTTASYFAGTQGSSLIFGGTTLFSSGTVHARFASAKPLLTVPANITAYAPGSGGTVVNFTAEAIDNTDGPLTPVCTPPSGSLFPTGTTTVTYSVTNSLGQTSDASFTVTVLASEIWTNSVASTWGTATNWSLGRVPSSTDPVLLTTNGQSFTTVPQITVGATSVGALVINSPTTANVLNYGGSTPQIMSIFGIGSEPLISITGNASAAVSVNKLNFRPRVSGQFLIESGKTFTLGNSYITENSAGLKLTKTGGGTLNFSGTGNPKITFTGGLDMTAGVWDAGSHTTCLPTSGVVNFTNLAGTTAVIQSTQSHSIGALGGGNSDSSINAATLIITGARVTTFGGKITGATHLTLSGSGSLDLTNSNTFTGAAMLSSGILKISGTLTQPGNLTVQTGATLENHGTISSTGSLAVNFGGVFRTKVTQSTPAALNVAGTVTLAGVLDVSAVAALTPGTTFTIVNKTGAGAVIGTFSGKAQGNTFTASGHLWSIRYTGGDGNDVTLTLATRQESWRQTHFSTTANIGPAADLADSNNDGEANLLEFATGQNPHAATLVTTTVVKNRTTLEFTYTRSLAAMSDGITFTVEWNDALAPESWSSEGVTEEILGDNGTVQTVKARVPGGVLNTRFVHLKVSSL